MGSLCSVISNTETSLGCNTTLESKHFKFLSEIMGFKLQLWNEPQEADNRLWIWTLPD